MGESLTGIRETICLLSGGKRTLGRLAGRNSYRGVKMQTGKRIRWATMGLLLATSSTAAPAKQRNHHALDTSGIESFNKSFADAVRSMNNSAVLSLWEDDGVALLPDTPPMRGKPAIRAMLESVTSGHPKARMESFTNECFDIERSGRWASEWCLEHQVVTEPEKPTFDSWGKMLLVLHRQASGEWRLTREMWNHADASERPSS